MKPIVIGLAGPIGSGKDTLAAALQTKLGVSTVRKLKFADALYQMAACIDPVIRPDMLHAEKTAHVWNDRTMPTRRRLLETLGTEWGRSMVSPNLWVNLVKKAILQAAEPIKVISDVRFEDEAALVRQHGFIVHLMPSWECARTGHKSDKGLHHHPDDHLLPLKHGAINPAALDLIAILRAELVSRGDLLGVP